MSDSLGPAERHERAAPSRRQVLTYVPALVGLGTAVALGDAAPARATGLQLVDFAERLVQPDQLAAAGYAGAVVYVSESRPGANFDFKPVTREYADALRASGLHVVSNFQYGKPGSPTPSDFTRGYDGGVADAQNALRLHGGAGGPASAPIFFSVDDDIDLDTWKSLVLAWFRGINSVLGVERTGLYGHAHACAWAIADDVIGTSSTAGRGRRGRGHAVSASPRPCSISPPSSPHQTPLSCWAGSTWTSTTCSPPTSVNGTWLGELVLTGWLRARPGPVARRSWPSARCIRGCGVRRRAIACGRVPSAGVGSPPTRSFRHDTRRREDH